MDADWRFQYKTQPTLTNTASIDSWLWRFGPTGEFAATTSGPDVFGGKVGIAEYKTTLPALAVSHRILHFTSVDDNATVFVNGKQLLHHEGWNTPFDVPLDTSWKTNGPNELTVMVENTAGAGGIMGPVTLGTLVNIVTSDPTRPEFTDRSWRHVHLPHDYVVEAAFDPKGDAGHAALPPKPAWYRKTFTLPASDKGKSLWIDFDGAYRDTSVWLNGVKLGNHPCGYTPFRFDISRAARYGGKNVLTVQTNPQQQEGWWYEGGGIYRHVWLNVADPVHIAPWGVFVTSQLDEPGPDGKAVNAVITVRTTIDSPDLRAAGKYTVVSRVMDPAGKPVGSGVVEPRLSGAEAVARPQQTFLRQDVTSEVRVTAPKLWSIETPQLYRLHTEIRQGNRVLDTQDTPFGIRTIRFDAEKGFFLNGKAVKIKGTCNHQDFAGVGVAMPDSLLYWRIKKLKEMGSNAYRCSHNPPTAELLDACDKLGMIVMDENRHLGDTEDGKASENTPFVNLSEVESMVLRDRNHPSVILWSMCNEEGIQSTTHGRDIFSAMKKVVDQTDGTRPVSCAMNGGYDSAVGITSVEDLQGINYHPGAYDGFHNAHPSMPLYSSETSSEVGTRGVYGPDNFKIDNIAYVGDQARGHISAYDIHAPDWAQTAEASWQPIADRSYVAGGFVWTGFDYKGEPTPFGWPDINSNFGILDMCGFPKDAFYYYQSVWGSKPMVHVFPHWNWAGKEGQPIDVWAYSNAERVELFLNGTSLGSKLMPKNGHVNWSVPYAPGTLTAKAYTGDTLISSDVVVTTGEAAGLRLRTDRTKLKSDGEDVTMVSVDVIDKLGRVVPTADNEVTFTLTGAAHIAGVGNGDPSCHEPDKASRRSAFNGHCLVIVGANELPGTIQLTASAAGLSSTSLALTSQRLK